MADLNARASSRSVVRGQIDACGSSRFADWYRSVGLTPQRGCQAVQDEDVGPHAADVVVAQTAVRFDVPQIVERGVLGCVDDGEGATDVAPPGHVQG